MSVKLVSLHLAHPINPFQIHFTMKEPLMPSRYIHQFIAALAALCALTSQAKDMSSIALEDMAAFRPQAGNWSIVGAADMNPDLDLMGGHDPKLNEQAVSSQAGEGILLNMNTKDRHDHILTVLEHGDIELDLEVMMPSGSNSGLYLQGRYEVQLLDSWGIKSPKHSDIGGIFRNWEEAPELAFPGIPPLLNACKAPGLWQHIHLVFRAPRFDSDGNKTANARFDFVDLNGARIHENIQVPRLTGGPIAKSEAATGPIMIQGDHGPVAIRNFKYRLLKPVEVNLENLSYRSYKGAFDLVSDFSALEPTSEGPLTLIDQTVANAENNYALTYEGTLVVNKADTYQIEFIHNGGGVLSIDGEVLVDEQFPDLKKEHTLTKQLDKGSYSLVIHNYKTLGWVPPRLALTFQGTNTHKTDFHTAGSDGVYRRIPSPILVDPEARPKLHRGFYPAPKDKLYSHTIAVGDPTGLHYVFDLESATIVAASRGPFIDATPMWHNRGNGTFTLRGSAQQLSAHSLFKEVEVKNTETPLLVQKGYTLDSESGRPTFRYAYQGTTYTITLEPDPAAKRLLCHIAASGDDAKEVVPLRIAEGDSIEELSDTRYIVGDRTFYIDIIEGPKPTIKSATAGSELITIIQDEPISFSIAW